MSYENTKKYKTWKSGCLKNILEIEDWIITNVTGGRYDLK